MLCSLELIISVSSFWHLFCRFEPTLFCTDPIPPSWIKTLSIYGPLTGSLAAHTGFIILTCSPLSSACITLSLSPFASISSLCESPATSHFVFPFDLVVLCVQFTYHWAFNLNWWEKTNKTSLASLQTASTDPPCFFTFPPSVWLILFFYSKPPGTQSLLCCHFPSHVLFSSPEDQTFLAVP